MTSFKTKLKENQNYTMKEYTKLVKQLEALEKDGHKVEAKGSQAAMVDDQLIVFLALNKHQNVKTGKSGAVKRKLTTYLK